MPLPSLATHDPSLPIENAEGVEISKYLDRAEPFVQAMQLPKQRIKIPSLIPSIQPTAPATAESFCFQSGLHKFPNDASCVACLQRPSVLLKPPRLESNRPRHGVGPEKTAPLLANPTIRKGTRIIAQHFVILDNPTPDRAMQGDALLANRLIPPAFEPVSTEPFGQTA